MFKIFDKSHKQVSILENPQTPIIKEELNGLAELSFSVPATEKFIELEGYIRVENNHEYVVKEIVTQGTIKNVVCVLNIEELLGMLHPHFNSQANNLSNTVKLILSETGWTYKNKSTSNVVRNLIGTSISSYNLLQHLPRLFDVEFYFDTVNKVLHLVDRVGADKGVYFTNELNLRRLNKDTHTHNLITRIIPIGKDGLVISGVNGGKRWLENHSYSDKVIYGVWNATNYEDPRELKADAQKYLDSVCSPYESYEIVVTDLCKLADNYDFQYELGDIITIVDSITSTRIKQRVVSKTTNLYQSDADTLTIANKSVTFQDYYKQLQELNSLSSSVINQDGTISGEAVADRIVSIIEANKNMTIYYDTDEPYFKRDKSVVYNYMTYEKDQPIYVGGGIRLDEKFEEELRIPTRNLFSINEGTIEVTLTPTKLEDYTNMFWMQLDTGRFILYINANGRISFGIGAVGEQINSPDGCIVADEPVHVVMRWSASSKRYELLVNNSLIGSGVYTPPSKFPTTINVLKNGECIFNDLKISNCYKTDSEVII